MYIIGVPQGPKIIPLLFYLDFSAFSNLSDVNIVTKNIQTHLNKIHSWMTKWEIILNPTKGTTAYYSHFKYIKT